MRSRVAMVVMAAAVAVSCSVLTAGSGLAGVTNTPAAASRGSARIFALSCASAGNCTAGGWYTDAAFRTQAFVVAEKNGTWGKAGPLPGLASLNSGHDARVESVSCASAGNCAAAGMYTGQSGGNDFPQPFVAAKENGRWGKPKKLRGIPDTFIGDQISCPSAGNCFIYGTYEPNSATEDSYVVREMHGRWGRVTRLGVAINSLSCWSGGNCAGGGNSTTGPVVIAEKNGRWGKPENVPGIKRVKGDNPLFGGPTVATVTCSSAGDC
ncbi:MAG: hypothetical protein ACRDPO_14095, partial [Streptosporangiaceae bacterium]